MSAIRTIACFVVATACVAPFATAEAAKPKSLTRHNPRVQEELKIKSKRGIQAAASSTNGIILTNATVCDVRTGLRKKK